MSDTPRLSELQLERLALGELPAAEATALRARMAPADHARLAAIATSNAEILAAHPPAAVHAEVLRRRAAATRRAPRALWLATPLAAAAATALVLWPADPPIDEPAPEPAIQQAPQQAPVRADPGTTRIKGQEPHLLVFRQEGEQAVPLHEPAEARPRDRLQLSYIAAGAPYGVVLSLDGAGVVTLHFPASDTGPTSLQQGGAVALEQSYELDAAPGFERFILVTADAPIHTATIVAAARQLAGAPQAASAPLVLPYELRQRSFLLRKVAP